MHFNKPPRPPEESGPDNTSTQITDLASEVKSK